jgi:hypothetical protein
MTKREKYEQVSVNGKNGKLVCLGWRCCECPKKLHKACDKLTDKQATEETIHTSLAEFADKWLAKHNEKE